MNPVVLAILLSAVNGEPARAANDGDAKAALQVESESAEAARFARDESGKWELFADGTKRTKLELSSEPVLRWSNPAAGRVYGSVFVWTAGGRPVAVASFYRWFSPYTQRTAEFVSLSPEALSAERLRRKQWAPPAGKVTFQPIPEAPVPDESAKKRLAQMRSLARAFVPELVDRRVIVEGTQQQLRLLDQPIYKYGAGEGGLLEGGLFAFVVGTDPEALLVIEAREGKEGRRWHYALARMNRDAVRVRHKDQEVWSVPHLETPWSDASSPYLLFTVENN
jgi:hypothetical protein